MEEGENWDRLISSILRAANILGKDLVDSDLPDFGEWEAARNMHRGLWAEVYSKRKKK